MYFFGGFSQLRINLPTRLCCFRQAFVICGKHLLFPTCALSEIREFRNWITHVTARHTRFPASRYKMTKIGSQTHRQGQVTATIYRRSYIEHSFVPTCQFQRVVGMNKREWITASCKNLRAVAYCSCTWDEEHPITAGSN